MASTSSDDGTLFHDSTTPRTTRHVGQIGLPKIFRETNEARQSYERDYRKEVEALNISKEVRTDTMK